MESSDDFREIAHSGGKIIFHVVADAVANIQYRVSFTLSSRPNPMRVFRDLGLAAGNTGRRHPHHGYGRSLGPASSSGVRPGLYSL
jgi:hypothetical protein